MERKRAAINGFAVVGFITVIFFGLVLAVYLARFIPNAVDGLATVVSSVFIPADNDENDVLVIDDRNDEDEDEVVFPSEDDEDDTPSTPVTPTPAPVAPQPGNQSTSVINVGGTGQVSLYGDPDLVPIIIGTGKLVGGNDLDDFVETDDLEEDDRIAVKFAILNAGTNRTGDDWEFEVTMPTEDEYTFTSRSRDVRNLNPGDRIEYVVGFDNPETGDDLEIEIVVDSDDDVDESNERNNDDTIEIEVDED